MKCLSIILLGVLLSFSHLISASPLDKGIKAIDNQKYDLAYKILLPLAETNNAEAQYYIGYILIDNLTSKSTPGQGVAWLEKAVDNKHREAAQILSKMYLSGMVVPLDVEKGQHYLNIAEQLKPIEPDGDNEDDCD